MVYFFTRVRETFFFHTRAASELERPPFVGKREYGCGGCCPLLAPAAYRTKHSSSSCQSPCCVGAPSRLGAGRGGCTVFAWEGEPKNSLVAVPGKPLLARLAGKRQPKDRGW